MVDGLTEDEFQAHVAARIEMALEECPIKGDKLADRIGISKTAIRKWPKTGQVSGFSLYRLSRVTGKPMAWFLPGYESSGEEEDSIRRLVESGAAEPEALEDLLLRILSARKRASNSE